MLGLPYPALPGTPAFSRASTGWVLQGPSKLAAPHRPAVCARAAHSVGADEAPGCVQTDTAEVKLRRSVGLKKDEYQLNRKHITCARVLLRAPTPCPAIRLCLAAVPDLVHAMAQSGHVIGAAWRLRSQVPPRSSNISMHRNAGRAGPERLAHRITRKHLRCAGIFVHAPGPWHCHAAGCGRQSRQASLEALVGVISGGALGEIIWRR